MDDAPDLENLRERLRLLKRRRALLLVQLITAGSVDSVTLQIHIEDADSKIAQLKKEIEDVSDDTPFSASKKSISSTKIIDRHITYIEKIAISWNERLGILEEKLKANKSDDTLREQTRQVREHVSYLLTRSDTVEQFKVLDGGVKISQMYICRKFTCPYLQIPLSTVYYRCHKEKQL
jgi:hypothetical protein